MLLTVFNLNISRIVMPQFTNISLEVFKKKHKHINMQINSSLLKPVQKELHVNIIKSMTNKYSSNEICNEMPIVISSDNYIIDGHHRWFYCNLINRTINAYKFNYSVYKLLYLSHLYT